MEERIDHMKYLPDMEQIDSDIPDRVIAEMNGYDPSIYTENDVKRALEHDEKLLTILRLCFRLRHYLCLKKSQRLREWKPKAFRQFRKYVYTALHFKLL